MCSSLKQLCSHFLQETFHEYFPMSESLVLWLQTLLMAFNSCLLNSFAVIFFKKLLWRCSYVRRCSDIGHDIEDVPMSESCVNAYDVLTLFPSLNLCNNFLPECLIKCFYFKIMCILVPNIFLWSINLISIAKVISYQNLSRCFYFRIMCIVLQC